MDKNLDVMLAHAREYVEQSLGPRCTSIMSEVAISINWSEGKAEILEGVTGRKYPKREGWQNGTADLVCLLETGELLIADWKTGGTDGATEQLLSLACGFQKVLMEPDSDGTSVPRKVLISCLKVDNQGVQAEERPASHEELANHWFAMEMVWGSREKTNEPIPGIHCTQLYCPHLAYCTAITGIVSETAKEDGMEPLGGQPLVQVRALSRKRMTGQPKDDYEAGHVMAQVTASRRQCKYYDTMMRQRIANGGRVISGNYEWRETNAGFRWGRVTQ